MINVGNRMVNNWVYPLKDGYVLIDTGYENGFSRLKSNLAKNNIKLDELRFVLLTHAHDDHAGFLNDLLSELPSLKVIMSDKSLDGLYKGQNSFEGGCTSKLALLFCNVMKLFGKGEHTYPKLKKEFESRCIQITEANKKEIGILLFGRIISTPGHTSDSISLMLSDGSLFCGDAVMNGLPSLNKITIWAENKDEFLESWKTFINLKPKVIYPGHGQPFTYLSLEKNMSHVQKMKLLPLK